MTASRHLPDVRSGSTLGINVEAALALAEGTEV
jgi:hypothetical protein